MKVMNALDKQYQDLLQDILDNGTKKETRNGDTISVFGRQIRHDMKTGFPLITTKKMAFKTMVTELLWFLQGSTNIKYLVDNNCHIWDGDCYKNYLKWVGKDPLTIEEFIDKIKTDSDFAGVYGDLGKIYGAQWRGWKHMGTKPQQEMLDENTNWPWKTTEIDQIANLINDLKTNPDSRRLLVSAWNPADLDSCVLPPCHYGFQVYTRELSSEEISFEANKRGFNLKGMMIGGKLLINPKEVKEKNIPTRAISLMFNMRSCDVPLGLPFNIASYGLLLEIIGKMVNMVPDDLSGNLGDTHIYQNQTNGVKEQLTRNPFTLPKLKHMKTDEFYKSLSEDLSLLSHLDNTDFVVENYQSHPTIKMPLSN